MKCYNCGYENNDNAKFCNECAAKLYDDNTKENVEESHEESKQVIKIDTTSIKQEEKEKNSDYNAKRYDLLKRRRIVIAVIIPFILIIGFVVYIGVNTSNPQEVSNQFKTDKNIALQEYNKLSDVNKQKVQTLIKNEINSLYETKTGATFKYDILAYNDIPELKSYIKDLEDKINEKAKYKKIYDEAQKEIDKAKGINNLKDYEVMGLLDDYCSIPETFENYDGVLDKIILLRDRYYKFFYNIPNSVKERDITIGMSKKEVLASNWGRPEKVNKTTNAYGTSEQWVYYGNKYLYFDGDKLTSIQN